MTWLMRWFNRSIATLNSTSRFLDIYIDVKHIIMENVNECPKGISLGTIFKNILWENDKTINLFDNFLYFL